jgi:DNA recombination protein RmuC
MEILFLLVGLILGFAIAFLFTKNKNNAVADTTVYDAKINELEKQNAVLKTQLDGALNEHQKYSLEYREEKQKLNGEIEKLRSDLNNANGRIEGSIEKFKAQDEKYKMLKEELETIHKKYSTEFEVIANKILDEKAQKFTDQNKTSMDIILNPLKENIKRFEEQVQKSYKTESDERITLKTEIKNLIDLNKQISEEANNLTKALKGENKTQGNWGELILEKVLERSGLVKDQEYRLQYSTNNEEGKRIQPDAVIMLPDNKHIIVDAKVSLVAYEALVNCGSEEERTVFIKEHLASVRTHVKSLSEKNYPTSPDFNTPDFVLLFIPIESSFSVAVQADQELFNFAWDKKIVIVSPSTLLATLRTISSVWKQERQNKNVVEIARQAGGLYDKFVGFLEDMLKIDKAIDDSRNAYQGAINKLNSGNGNIVKRVENLKNLGAKTEKSIPVKFIGNGESPLLTEDTSA